MNVMSNTDNEVIEITDGPSREDLFDALRLGPEKATIDITIKIKRIKRTVNFWVNGLEREDGSQQSWIIKVHDPLGALVRGRHNFEGYLNTRTREGHLRV